MLGWLGQGTLLLGKRKTSYMTIFISLVKQEIHLSGWKKTGKGDWRRYEIIPRMMKE